MNDKPANRHRDLRSLIRDDAYAASFQSLGQYRTALLEYVEPAVQGEPLRHPATPSFLEYPSFEESANFDPVPAVQGEPVAWVTADTVDGQTVNGKPRRVWWENNEGVGMPIYTAPQPSFQLPDFATDPDDSDEVTSLWDHGFKRGWNSCLGVVTEAMQSAEHQPAPDVEGLVEALEAIGRMDYSDHCLTNAVLVARAALAAHRKGGDTQ